MDVAQYNYDRWLQFYDWALSLSDARVKGWLLMGSPWPTLQLTALYLLLVYQGQRFMKDKQAIECKLVLALYNLTLVLLNLYIFLEILISTTKAGYSYQCQPVKHTEDANELRLAKALWWYYFSKCLEFLDTIFFVIRKKKNQISFLHIYHHASMFPLWWIGVKWVAGGMSFFGAMINSFIHVVMYTYYGLSALGPKIQKYLWWKRYLTKLQLLQFFAATVYGVQGLALDCDFPKWMQYSFLAYGMSMIILFANFYRQTYHTKKRDNSNKSTNGDASQNGHSIKNGLSPQIGHSKHD